jgi:hypothetical protein
MEGVRHSGLLLASMVIVIMASGDPGAIVEEIPQRALEAESAWNEGGMSLFQSGDTAEVEADLLELRSKSPVEKREALADAHVKEDQAALALSTDAQDLEDLKGDMSEQVVRAKAQIAAKNSATSHATAKKAAALARQVMHKSTIVKADQSKEKFAKDTVKRVASLVAEDSSDDSAADTSDDTEDASSTASATTDSGPDPISKQLLSEAKDYKSVKDKLSASIDKDKKSIATLETTVQTLADKLATAKKDLASTNTNLQRRVAKFAKVRQLYSGTTTKEKHHKQTRAIELKIRKQKEALEVQNMKIANSKEMLRKSMDRQAQLEGDKQAAVAKLPDPADDTTVDADTVSAEAPVDADAAAGPGAAAVAAASPASGPAMSAAVDAVSTNLQNQNLEAELLPQVQKLKETLHGAALHKAIDQLVSATVAQKVNTAFESDPSVGSAVQKAVSQVRSKIKKVPAEASKGPLAPSPTQAQEQAQLSLSKVMDAQRSLDDVDSRLEGQADPGEVLLSGLAQAMGTDAVA